MSSLCCRRHMREVDGGGNSVDVERSSSHGRRRGGTTRMSSCRPSQSVAATTASSSRTLLVIVAELLAWSIAQFFQSRELPVVDMRLRHVNLEAHLHTNEKYETYFKRRIANIVSSYCEHQANECPGATLRLTQTVSDASQSDDDDDDKSVLYAADDESEPLLTQNNVVLLRVEREPVNVTRILFAITKSENVGSLNEQMIIDPVKVKYILGSQAGPLARILGGIKLDSVRVSRIRRHLTLADTDNTKLITIISIVGAFFAICYIIGAIRLCR
ncbi:hypothetical protein ANCDUO_08461 [Ancylostoma duodenale]|uniref:Uncharacterized protein n=1 Tax=Ancylostoma duodenale TaxID=51022 RepID=A0A0C2DFN6_9BILA|nr:hypothetical protein ANCDUO_08461 [Ancylostoma duodenale]